MITYLKRLFPFFLSLLPTLAYTQTPNSCTALTKLHLPNTNILQAQSIAAGAPTSLPDSSDPVVLPAICRVLIQLTPSFDSDIRMELWLPLNWNHSFRGQGNGGFAGDIDYTSLTNAVSQGYATAATDTGHVAAELDATWALNHPQKVVDFGYRAIHLMTQTSQQLIQNFYATPASHSFFTSCSDGGREALMEAERFPDDYDGIVAGDPAYDWVGDFTSFVANANALTQTSGSYLPSTDLPLINAAVLQTCGTQSEIRDGFLTDPRTCKFSPQTLACKAGQDGSDASCLTQPQIASLQTLYNGTTALGGALIAHGYLPGGELGTGGWAPWLTGTAPGNSVTSMYGSSYFANMVFSNPQWTSQNADAGVLFWSSLLTTGLSLNATNPNLIPFFSRGGKLILYHGWNDPAISPQSTLDYFNQVNLITGPRAAQSMRLYMVPGMQHCIGGPGPTFFGQVGWQPGEGPDDPQHDIQLAIEQWINANIAPQAIIAGQYDVAPAPGNITLTRPLCPYPQVATYQGSGNTNDAVNYVCTVPK